MDYNVEQLIYNVVSNRTRYAKEYAKAICLNNKSKRHEDFCNQILKKLDEQENKISLPDNMKNLLELEEVTKTFIENRHYFRESEINLVEKVIKTFKASNKLKELSINYPTRLMLYGESGTGKTTLGKYIAYKLNKPFVYMNFSYMIDSLLGETNKNMSKAFNTARDLDCVLMIDEIDAIGTVRGGKSETGEMSRIAIGLMQNLDKLPSDIVVIGATNRIDIIDPAIIRRFSFKQEILRPQNIEERKKYAERFLDDIGIKYNKEYLDTLCSDDKTQSGLINTIIEELVNMLSK